VLAPREEAKFHDERAAFARGHTPLIVSVGGLEPEYRIELQVDAMAAIRERHPKAGLMVIGSGAEEEILRAHVARSPAASGILLCGDVPHAETLEAIRRADVVLRTTEYDGDSVAVREALALGTRVVASDTGMRPPGVVLLGELSAGAIARATLATLDVPVAPLVDFSAPGSTSNLDAVVELYEDAMRENGR
jgi:glycosyltransferase involved in cell wall biosynthesis